MDTPFEVIAGAGAVFVAPNIAEAEPAIDAVPAGTWVELAAKEDITEEGIAIRMPQAQSVIRAAGTTGPRKVFRTEEDLFVEFTVMDATAEAYARLLDNKTVTDTAAGAGTAGHRAIDTLRGSTVKQWSLLVRLEDIAPYDDSAAAIRFNTQWWIPQATIEGEPETVYVKGEPVGLRFVFRAMQHTTSGFGKLRMQDAAPA